MLICKHHYVLIKQLNVFPGNHNCKYVYRRLSLFLYIPKHGNQIERKLWKKQEITTIRTSDESHLYWKNQFHKNRLFFRVTADFEVDNEYDNSSIGDKFTNIYE